MTHGLYVVMVTGSRDFHDRKMIHRSLGEVCQKHDHHVLLISGLAAGVDSIARDYAMVLGWALEDHPINKKRWELVGKREGQDRNRRMVDSLHGHFAKGAKGILLAFSDNIMESNGTRGCVEYAISHQAHASKVWLFTSQGQINIPRNLWPANQRYQYKADGSRALD